MDENVNNTIVIDRTLVSRLTGLVVIVGLFLFVVGYFLGKKQGVHEFLKTFEQESFADQIYTALHSLYPLDSSLNDYEFSLEKNNTPIVPLSVRDNEPFDEQKKGYYAHIIGFRTRKAADYFKERLRKKGIETIVKERQSTTLKGKKSVWYQVSTIVYTEKTMLVDIIEQIKRAENIKEISIRMV